MQSHLRVLCVLCGYCFFAHSYAKAAELVRLGGDSVEASLQAVHYDSLTFLAKAPLTSPIDELVRWGHPQPPRPQILVVLADGGRLVAAVAWSGGAPLRLESDNLIVLTDVWNEVSVPRSLVRGLVFVQRSDVREREKLEGIVRGSLIPPAEAGSPDAGSNDVVLLTNQDRVTGKLVALSGGSLALDTDAGSVKLPLSRVEAIVFGQEASGGSPTTRRQPPSLVPSLQAKGKLVVGLRDGSLLYADKFEANEEILSLLSTSGLKLDGGNISDVALLQSLGGRLVYLSNLEPAAYRHVPYLSIEWPYQRDRNVLGGPLAVGGKRYLKGIGMHSAARLTYRLDGNYRRFDAAVALDDSAGRRGSVTFGAYLQRDGQWIEAYTSGIVRGGEAPRPVSVDVAGAQGLTLTVDFADRGDELDHADWLDARLVRN